MIPEFRYAFNRICQWLRCSLGFTIPAHPDPAPSSPPPASSPRPDLVSVLRPFPLSLPASDLPAWVTDCPVAMAYHTLLHPLDWASFPERPDDRPWSGKTPTPRACFAATYLVKLYEQKRYMSDVRAFLIKHPALVWLPGFPLKLDTTASHGFNPETTVPTRRHLSHVLRMLPNDACQSLLNSSIRCIQQSLPTTRQDDFAQTVSGDTKHIIAWVKENNPKAYVKQRFDKTRQPNGDRDCKLGVKRRRNKTSSTDQGQEPRTFPTPTTDAKPATNARHEKEAYWGGVCLRYHRHHSPRQAG